MNALDDFSGELYYSCKTIAFVDVVESVRLVERDEQGAVGRMRQFLLNEAGQVVDRHDGSCIERHGDGLLLEFPNARSALSCATALHGAATHGHRRVSAADRVHLRIGIHQADVLTDEVGLYGHGVNLASRITAFANSGETLVSSSVAGELVDGIDGKLDDLGECYLKHVSRPVHLYRIGPSATPGPWERAPGAPVELNAAVAVMPFVPYDEDDGVIGIGDIVTDQLIGTLSCSNTLNVISRLSTNALRGRDLSVGDISNHLAADFVVSGRYWIRDGRINVNAELAQSSSGKVLWAHSVVDSASAALHRDSLLIGELAAGIAGAIFNDEVHEAHVHALPNLHSHTLLLAAIGMLYRLSVTEFAEARRALLALHERAPRHPTPLAWLARWHLFRIVQGWSSDRDRDGRSALDYANRALDIDPQSSLALTMAGNVQTSYLKDLQAADDFYDAALRVNPSESLAWLQKGNAQSFRGDGALALQSIERAISLSPLDPSRHFYDSLLASAALSAGDYERAIEAAASSLRLNREHVSTYRALAIAQSLVGRDVDARESVQQILVREPALTVASFVARSPGGSSGLVEKFAEALHKAGLPPGKRDDAPTGG